MKQHTVYLRQKQNGGGRYGWQYARLHPDDPDCRWWGNYKTAGVARGQARRTILYAKDAPHVPTDITFVVWGTALLA